VKRKGVSQVLSLIVAAAVLMMAALTLIILVTGGLGDFGADLFGGTCSGAIESSCQAQGGGTVSIPSSCLTGGELTEEANQFDMTSNYNIDLDDGEVACAPQE